MAAIRTAGREIREARIAADLSLRDVASAARMSHGHLARVERGLVPEVAAVRLFEVAAIVGLELSLRAYPAGDPLRDAAQVALLERLRSRLHPSLRWQTEIPLALPGDQRAWDARISGPDWRLAIEAETAVRDAQALERRIALKARDGAVEHVLLLVRHSRRNRAAIGSVREALRARFQLDGRAILAALREGRNPGGGILFL